MPRRKRGGASCFSDMKEKFSDRETSRVSK